MNKRPGWITLIAVLKVIVGITFFLVLLPSETKRGNHGMAIGFILLSLYYIATGMGLMRLKNWARQLTIIEASISIVGGVLSKNIISAGISGLIIYYLVRKDIQMIFYQSSTVKKKKKTSGDRRSMSATEKKRILGRAHLNLGKIYEIKKDSERAIDHYNKALNKSIKVSDLPVSALALIAQSYISKDNKSHQAREVYLELIKQKTYSDAKNVYSYLKKWCYVDDKLSPALINSARTLNSEVIKARNDIEWAHYYLGLTYLLKGNASEAVSSLKRSRDLDPRNIDTYYRLLKSLLKLRDEDVNAAELQEIFENALKYFSLVPDDEGGRRNQAEIYFEVGKLTMENLGGLGENIEVKDAETKGILEQATGYFEKAASLDERNAEYLFYLGRIYSLDNDAQRAIESLLGAIKLDGTQKEFYYYLAKEYIENNSVKDAKSCLRNALNLDNEYIDALSLLSEQCLSDKEYEEAENLSSGWITSRGYNIRNINVLIPALYYQNKFGAIVEAEADIRRLWKTEEGSKIKTEAVFHIARSLAMLNIFDKAIEWYEELIKKAPSSRNYYYYACALANNGDYELSLAQFNEVIHQKNDYMDKAYLQRGNVNMKLGNGPSALSDYQKSYELDPDDAGVLYALGSYHYNSDSLDEAFSWFSRCLAVNPDDGYTHFALGLNHEKQGDAGRALKEYETALENGADFHSLHLRLGVLYCKQMNYQKAVEHLYQARETGSGHELLLYLGLALLHSKKISSALEEWKQLYDQRPDDIRLELNIFKAHYLLGIEYIQEGRYREAAAAWEKYLTKYVRDEKTRKDLAQIYFKAACSRLSNNGEAANIKDIKELFERAYELDEDNDNYNFFISISDLSIGEYSKSIKALMELNERHCGNARIMYHLALALLRNGESEKASALFNEIIESSAGESEYKNYSRWIMANELIKKGQYEQAIPILEVLQ